MTTLIVPPGGGGVFGISAIAGSKAATYSWADWSQFVQTTFAKYTSVATADINAVFGGNVYEPAATPYNIASGAGAAGISTFIWGTTFGGPTGNGVNAE